MFRKLGKSGSKETSWKAVGIVREVFWTYFKGRTSRFRGVGNHEFNLKNVLIGVPARCKSREISWAVGITHQEPREEVWV